MRGSIRVTSSSIALVLALLALGAVAPDARAEIVRTGTGCLKLSTGTLSKIKVGQVPLSPCVAGEVIARVSHGDITAIATPVTGGLEGGTINGDASIALQTSFRLPQSCAAGQMPKWNGAAWECATAPAGGGGGLARLEDLRGLPCNSGIEAGTVSLAINPASHTVTLSCPRLGQFQLDVAVGGPGAVGTIPPDIDCGNGYGSCSHGYPAGDLVTLTETHEADVAAFDGWGGACGGADETCQVTMDQARQVSAHFLPTLTVNVGTLASSRDQSCVFTFCTYFDRFTDSRARVTVTDLDTGLNAGTCDADTTAVNNVTQFMPPSAHVTTCNLPVQPGHQLRLQAEDSSTLGGTQTFLMWPDGACANLTDPICTPAAPVTVHDQQAASFL